MPERVLGPLPPPAVVAFAVRERARDVLKRGFPRRRGRVTLVRSRAEALDALRTSLTDAVIVDLAQPGDEHWAVASLAREFPSIPFLALAPLRPAEVPHLARACAEYEFADVLVEGVEDSDAPRARAAADLHGPVRRVAARRGHRARPDGGPAARGLAPRARHGGRTVRTDAIAESVQLTREHLSRRFSADGAPNLKRIIDLVRILASADLAKNPGYDLPDVARTLGFASASHLSASCQRIIGVRSSSLARLRPADLIDRFVKQGRGRSRVA
jgi:AraC-like DNA-binding protein